MTQLGFEPATSGARVRDPNHYTNVEGTHVHIYIQNTMYVNIQCKEKNYKKRLHSVGFKPATSGARVKKLNHYTNVESPRVDLYQLIERRQLFHLPSFGNDPPYSIRAMVKKLRKVQSVIQSGANPMFHDFVRDDRGTRRPTARSTAHLQGAAIEGSFDAKMFGH